MLNRLFRHKTKPVAGAPTGGRVYAIGDVHGRLDLLRALYRLIEQDAAGTEAPCRIVLLGDYVDRGPESAGVIDFVLEGIDSRFDPVFLKGNHEQLMLDFLEDPAVGPAWFATGGADTVLSYGVRVGSDRIDHAEISARLAEALPPAHRAFLDALAVSHRWGNYVFAHAGIRPRIPLERQDTQDLLWIRREFLSADGFGGLCVVHGHSQVTDPVDLPHRVAVDTGAYHSGRLTAAVLDAGGRRFLSTGDRAG
ncbi:metallophosphoesterase [Iodidimonas sp. SYSU 1G8]|uniref:metallophosphoesterase n=1 Tax=Iodidimonas sp. SYSU 1G8 TaxID=3133967 RepID=UPI0031FF0960